MANIPLQSISFPGLSDKYTTPVVDNTLTQAGAAADAKKTGDEIGAIKNDFVETLVDAADIDIFSIGGIRAASGEDMETTNRLRTKMFDDVFRVTALTGYKFLIYAYNGNTYVGSWDGTQFRTSGTAFVSDFIIDVSLPYVYRVGVMRDDNADVSISEAQNIIFRKSTDATLSVSGKAADAKITGDNFENIRLSLRSISTDGRITIYNIDNVENLTAGKAIDGTGAVTNQTASYCLESYIEIPDHDVNISSSVRLASGSNVFNYIVFYDENYDFISRAGGRYIYDLTVKSSDIPVNAKYVRWTLSYAVIGNVASCDFSIFYPLDYILPSPKNKWYILGDSVSAGYYSMTQSMAEAAGVTMTYVSDVTTESGETTGSVWDDTLAHNYWGYANKWKLNRELSGLAYPGQGYFRTASNSKNGINVVSENDFSDAGLITVAWGFNDWHYNQVRGNHDLIDPSVPYPTANYDTTQITTVNQAIWYCLGELIRKAPNAKIVVQTPMNGWAYGGDFASNWGIGTSKTQSGTLADIHDDIVYWANYYGLQVLEMTYNNSVVNRKNIKDTMIDGSHPSDAAHQQLGRVVAVALEYC